MEEDGVEFTGRTVEDAITQAETRLGANRATLDIQIVTSGSRGVFGIGAEPARVRVRRPRPAAPPPVEVQPAPAVPELEPVTPQVSAPEPVAQAVRTAPAETGPAVQEAPAPSTAQSAQAPAQSDLPNAARDVLQELLTTMGFDAQVTVRSVRDPIMLAITGDNLGVLIGRRGDNLAALQFMVNLILSKNRRQWPKIVIDVENYRARREESLRTLADRIAYRVRRNYRPFTLEAMPASDRRVIHLALRDSPDVETYSIGEGASRRVVIAPKRAGGDQRNLSQYR